ncbi:uncharacterized protein VP01_1040g3 [Puccinia sorghi]|uniref:Uncharacterized protein n=1 Tax=Puccinia sorghi TaxID=27349 RepID=A0A0L6VUH8_9BASI|nr:uncharacterized protein VP01_1040g3 [Puccinia sorghi]
MSPELYVRGDAPTRSLAAPAGRFCREGASPERGGGACSRINRHFMVLVLPDTIHYKKSGRFKQVDCHLGPGGRTGLQASRFLAAHPARFGRMQYILYIAAASNELTWRPESINWWSSTSTDQDTDRYLFEVLDPSLRLLLAERKQSMQWTDNVLTDCLLRLADRGFTQAQIAEAFGTLPLVNDHPAMKRAIEALSSVRSSSSEGEGEAVVTNELLILSNSNAMFIELVLKHYGLFERFEGAVITNPATWDPQDPNRLILSRRVDPQATPHGCTLGCSANMCKAAELLAYLERNKSTRTYERIVYVGDGDNDYCPISRVLESMHVFISISIYRGDIALVRSRRELARRIERESCKGNMLCCRVMLWEGAWEVEQIVYETLLKGR